MVSRLALLLGTTVLSTATLLSQGAWAQGSSAVDTAQAGEQRAFSVPPGPLGNALTLFGRQAGLQVSVDPAIVQGVSSPGVTGAVSVDVALTRLLSGSGLTYRIVGNTVTLQRPNAASGALQLDPVQVQGFSVPSQAMIDNLPPPYAGGQVATGGQLGLLGNRSVMDTPFNQTSYTAKKAQEQQATTIRDVLIDDPSVRSYVPDGGIGANIMRIRGFQTSNTSTAYGGLYGILPMYSTMVELAERVEVLKGPSAMLNGMPPFGNIGGSINVIAKRAPADPLTQITADYASNSQFGAHADVARRFGDDKQVGVRFNGVFKGGQTPVDGNSDQRSLAVLGLDFRGERVRLAADLGFQYEYIGGLIPYLGVANNVALPWAPDAKKNFGQPWGYQDRKDLFGVLRGEVDLTERITAYAAFGARDFRLGQLTGGNFVTATNFTGNAIATPSNTSQYWQYQTGEVGIRGLVDTGPIEHEFAVSATTLASQTGFGSVNGTAYATNIYSTNVIARPNIVTPAANKTGETLLSSLAFADTLSAAEKKVQLTVGARLQRVQATNFNAVSGMVTGGYDQSALSPSVALVIRPWRNVSFYGNFIQGLEQGLVVGPAFANAGDVFAPYKSTQFETGIKVDWGKLTTTVSLFQISQPSTITNVATNTLVVGGEQVNQGLEFNFFGEITDGVRVLGGAMFLNAVLTKTQGGATDGWIAPFSPGAQFNLGGEWDLPFVRGLTLTGRVLYTGAQYFDTTFPRRSLPEWTRFDVGARYAFEGAQSPTGNPIVARFGIENVLDANYWASGGGATTLNLGAPRTFRLSLTADF